MVDSISNQELLQTCIHAARSAGDILLDHFGRLKSEDIREKQANDFLTFVDESAEQKIISIIREKYPDHAVLAEERGKEAEISPFQWIIDPLDGTRNYITGIPVFAVSIALQVRDQLHMGVVYDPCRDELYHAIRGDGAYCNDRPVHVSRESRLARSLLATGFPFRFKSFLSQYMDCFEDIFRQISGARRMGAAAIDLAYVASGKFEAFWELGLNAWDMAAGSVLIREAGGRVTDFWGGDQFLSRSYIIASNGLIHTDLQQIITTHFTEFREIS